MYQLYRERPLLIFAIITVNILLSFWCFYNDPVINNDGVIYLALAQYFEQGEWQAAFDFYSWPYYSIFIVALAKLFFIDVESAAYLLNALLATSLTLAFVSIVSELSASDRRVVLIAAVVILLFPSINKYRAFIIRDFGYLSFYLWSLYFIFRFCSTFRKQHLIAWLICAALSCLFRFEGILFVLVAPYFLLLFSATNLPHRRTILLSLSVVIIILSLLLLGWYVNDKYASLLAMASKTGADIKGISDLFFANIEHSLGNEKLTIVSFIGVLGASLIKVFYELIRRMAVFYLIFSVYAYIKKLVFRNELHRKVWLVFLAANIATLIGFSVYNSFLVSRYTLASVLTLLILAPFAINQLLLKANNGGVWAKGAMAFVLLSLFIISADRLAETTDKMHLKNAGQWLANNISHEDRIYSNNKLIIYYADRSPEDNLNHLYSKTVLLEFFATDQIRHFDYLAFDAKINNQKDNVFRQTLQYQLGHAVYIDRVSDDHLVFVFDLTKYKKRGHLKS